MFHDVSRRLPAAGLRGALGLALVLALSGCAAADDSKAVLHTATGDYPFTIEIADAPDEHAHGLMYRESLAPDAGMLFDYGRERQVSFWMQNTLIPLDMVFIGTDGVVRAVHAEAIPLDTTAIPSGVPVQFVLEIPGGRAAEIGLEPGDTLEHPRVGQTWIVSPTG